MTTARSPELAAIVDRVREAWRPLRAKLDPKTRGEADAFITSLVSLADAAEKSADAASLSADEAREAAEDSELHKDEAHQFLHISEAACKECNDEAAACRRILWAIEDLKEESQPAPEEMLEQKWYPGSPRCPTCFCCTRPTDTEDERRETVFECPQCKEVYVVGDAAVAGAKGAA